MTQTSIARQVPSGRTEMPVNRHSLETLASDAIERIAGLLGIAVDLDAPEPALIASVERALTVLLEHRSKSHSEPSETRHE